MRLFYLLLVCSCLTVTAIDSDAQEAIISSPNDEARYESMTLANNLRVVVISNPNADKAAAALSVLVGAGSDPKDRAGLAHFLEHMLFLGTEKYPQVGEYQSFIRSNGGSQNAFTSYEFTTYYFDVEPSSLEPALDRFSQFFVAPLFDPKYVSREVNAVDSEYRARLKDDGRRRSYATKAVFNAEHPYAGFTTGNLETLDHDGLRDALLTFYATHYSANIMTLAVIGTEPTEILKQWVVDKFSAVKDKGVTPLSVDVPLFPPQTLPLLLHVTPNKDRRNLNLTFPITPTRHLFRSKPTYLVGALLGYEGPGSLLSTLREKGWADGVSAGGGISLDDTATFSIGIALTEDGLAKIDDIVHVVFQQIRNLREHGVTPWIYEEQRALSELEFRFQDPPQPSTSVLNIASGLHEYPIAEVIRGPYVLDEYQPAQTARLLSELVPENLLLTLFAKELSTGKTTKWYDTPYGTQPISAAQIERWSTPIVVADMRVQSPNNYIPTDLALLPDLDNHDAPPHGDSYRRATNTMVQARNQLWLTAGGFLHVVARA